MADHFFYSIFFVVLVFIALNAIVLTAMTKDKRKGTDDRKDKDPENLADFTSENPQPSLRISKEGRLIYANAASLPLVASWDKRVGDIVSNEWRNLATDVLASGLRENIELECKGRVYAFVAVPIKTTGYVNLYGRDITEEKKAMEKLKKAYTDLKETQSHLVQAEKMQVVGTLASGIAHEVKNPLAIILQGVEYFSRNVKTEDKNLSSVLKYIEEAVRSADATIKGLLDFSSSSKLSMETEDLHAVIEKSLSLVKHQSDKSHVRVVKDFGKNIHKVKIDKNRIGQVFVNLFLNAVQAMPDGGELKIKTYEKKLIKRGYGISHAKKDFFEIEEQALIAEIEDTGKGIPREILDKVFDPFFTTKRGRGGSGLGLSIVRNIVEMHDGTIELVNKEEGGIKATLAFKI